MSDLKDIKLTSKERHRVLLRALKMNDQADRGYTLRITLAGVLSLAGEYLFILLISSITNGIAEGRELKELLISTAAISAVCFGAQILIKFINRRESTHKFKHDNGLTKILNDKLMDMDYVHLEEPDMQWRCDLCNSYLGSWGVTGAAEVIGDSIVAIARITIGVVFIVPAVFQKNDLSGFGGFITSPWGFLAAVVIVTLSEIIKNLYFSRKNFSVYKGAMNDKDQMLNNSIYFAFANHVVKDYRRGKDIRLYAEQELILREIEKSTEKCRHIWQKAFLKFFKKYSYGMDLMCLISYGVMYGYAILRAVFGVLSPGEVIAFMMLFSRLLSGITAISNNMVNLKISAEQCKEVFDFLDIPDEKYKGTIPTEKRSDNEYEFEFHNVWFKYPGSEQYVLRDINMKWRIGEKMALVGRNGCGKSTLVKLLCRLYDPTKGEITLNGIDIRKYDYDEYMALFAVVFQDSKLFSFSAAENVAASTEFDSERVEDCIRRSGLSERLDSMPNGINTYLYKDFDEEGVEISGGEAQKLCLARAVYKGSPFIVLDEPTAALDPISEHDIYTNFNNIVGTRTAVYISHRLSSCRFCDEITVMDNGEIVERGNHEELIKAGGNYSKLWSAQAEYYKDTAGALFE